MSVQPPYVMHVGDLRRPLIGKAVFGTLLASAIFFLFTATKQTKSIYFHAPWVNDPYDTVFSFTMFFVPLLAATVLVQVSLCVGSQSHCRLVGSSRSFVDVESPSQPWRSSCCRPGCRLP